MGVDSDDINVAVAGIRFLIVVLVISAGLELDIVTREISLMLELFIDQRVEDVFFQARRPI